MLLAYLILTTVVSFVVLIGTANRHDSYRYWKYWMLATLVWPGLVAWGLFLSVRKLVHRMKLRVVPRKFSFKEVPGPHAYHTLEAEEALIEAMESDNE